MFKNNRLQLGDTAPQFSLPATDGNIYALHDFQASEALVVVFSCNHCPYVRAYENRLNNLALEFAASGVALVAINSNDAVAYTEDSFAEMKKRSAEMGFAFPYLYDETQETARAYGAAATPEVFLFNRERTLVYYGKIDDNWKEPAQVKNTYLKDAVMSVLAGKSVDVPETYAVGCSIKWKD